MDMDILNASAEEILAIVPDTPPQEHSAALRAEAKLKKLSIPPVTLPDAGELKFPGEMSALSDIVLGDIYGKFMSWSGYCRYLMTLKEADILVAKNRLLTVRRVLKNSAHERSQSVKMTVDARRDFADAHPAVLALEKVLTNFEVERRVVEARYAHFENCSRALSREISRREMESERKTL